MQGNTHRIHRFFTAHTFTFSLLSLFPSPILRRHSRAQDKPQIVLILLCLIHRCHLALLLKVRWLFSNVTGNFHFRSSGAVILMSFVTQKRKIESSEDSLSSLTHTLLSFTTFFLIYLFPALLSLLSHVPLLWLPADV